MGGDEKKGMLVQNRTGQLWVVMLRLVGGMKITLAEFGAIRYLVEDARSLSVKDKWRASPYPTQRHDGERFFFLRHIDDFFHLFIIKGPDKYGPEL